MPPQLTGGLMPLESIFAKSELDQLVAEAWLLSECSDRQEGGPQRGMGAAAALLLCGGGGLGWDLLQ